MNRKQIKRAERSVKPLGALIGGAIYSELYECDTVCAVPPGELPHEMCWDDYQVRRNGIRADTE